MLEEFEKMDAIDQLGYQLALEQLGTSLEAASRSKFNAGVRKAYARTAKILKAMLVAAERHLEKKG